MNNLEMLFFSFQVRADSSFGSDNANTNVAKNNLLKQLSDLGIDADMSICAYMWKVIFKSEEDMNLFKSAGKFMEAPSPMQAIMGGEKLYIVIE